MALPPIAVLNIRRIPYPDNIVYIGTAATHLDDPRHNSGLAGGFNPTTNVMSSLDMVGYQMFVEHHELDRDPTTRPSAIIVANWIERLKTHNNAWIAFKLLNPAIHRDIATGALSCLSIAVESVPYTRHRETSLVNRPGIRNARVIAKFEMDGQRIPEQRDCVNVMNYLRRRRQIKLPHETQEVWKREHNNEKVDDGTRKKMTPHPPHINSISIIAAPAWSRYIPREHSGLTRFNAQQSQMDGAPSQPDASESLLSDVTKLQVTNTAADQESSTGSQDLNPVSKSEDMSSETESTAEETEAEEEEGGTEPTLDPEEDYADQFYRAVKQQPREVQDRIIRQHINDRLAVKARLISMLNGLADSNKSDDTLSKLVSAVKETDPVQVGFLDQLVTFVDKYANRTTAQPVAEEIPASMDEGEEDDALAMNVEMDEVLPSQELSHSASDVQIKLPPPVKRVATRTKNIKKRKMPPAPMPRLAPAHSQPLRYTFTRKPDSGLQKKRPMTNGDRVDDLLVNFFETA